MKLNLNDEVRVKLTVNGVLAYRRYVEDSSGHPGHREYLMDKINEGWLTERFYTIMCIFGRDLYIGNSSHPFEPEIELLRDGPVGLLRSMVESYDMAISVDSLTIDIRSLSDIFGGAPDHAKKFLAGLKELEPSYGELMEIVDSYAQISHQMRNERDALRKEYERVYKIAFACPPKGDV